MSVKQVLALSSSRVGNETYLQTAALHIKNFLGEYPLKIAFIPFASVNSNYGEYAANVCVGLSALPYIINVVDRANATNIIEQCDAIMVGGGNTFKLLHDIIKADIFDLIKNKVNAGTPYVGWSAGANITSPTIGTTNDMPIIQPRDFKGLEFFSFQINPHYYNQSPEGFNGETRDQRLLEFIQMNPDLKVVGLPEGTALQLHGADLKFVGHMPCTLFYFVKNNNGSGTKEILPGENLSYLL